MKILQLNVWGGRLGSLVTNLLNREKPDIVCFQEVIDVEGGDGFVFDGLSNFKKTGEFNNVFFSPAFSWKLMKRQARSGLAILSKFSFLDTNNVFTGLEYVDNFDILEDDYNIRSLQHISIETDTGRVNILNHHGHHIAQHKDGDEETLRQCKMIVEYMNKLEGPIVLCGDFNLKPNSESLELINSRLINHAKEQGVLTTRTPLTHKTEVCDYIFTSADLNVKVFQVLDDIVSDHKALLVEI